MVNSITTGARGVVVGLFLVGMPLLALPQVGAWLKKQDFSQRLMQLLPQPAETPPPQLIATGPEMSSGATTPNPITAFMVDPQAAAADPSAFSGTPATAFDTVDVKPARQQPGVTPVPQRSEFKPAPPLAKSPGDAFQGKQLPRETASRTPSHRPAFRAPPQPPAVMPPAAMPHLQPGTAAPGSLNRSINSVNRTVPAPGNFHNGEPWYRVTTRIQNRLRQLGAKFFRLEEIEGKQYRCQCELPLPATPVYRRPFTATAADPLVAMQQLLSDVEKWAAANAPPANAVYRHDA